MSRRAHKIWPYLKGWKSLSILMDRWQSLSAMSINLRQSFCLPIFKREEDRQALIGAAISGNPKFFLGTDSAPHARDTKEAACGCAGMYTAHAGIELYAEIFGAYNALEKLEGFASVFGPAFYGLPRNPDKITLVKEAWSVAPELPFPPGKLVPFRAGGTVAWRML